MLNPALTKQKLDNLANYIESRDPASAGNMRDLGNALVGGPTADTWAFSSVRSVVDPELIANNVVGDSSSDFLVRGLEILRNSLVLLPLAITWFGIALAVDGYYRLIGAHPELAGQSFIYLWQGAFQKNMLLNLPLGTLAAIDAVLLAGVFLLTLLAYARGAWLSMMNWRFGTGFNRVLNEALAEAELLLSPRRGSQYYAAVRAGEQNAQQLLKELADEQSRIGKMAQQRERELGELSGITDNMQNSAVVFLNAAQSLANTHTATLAALNGVTGTIKALSVSQQDVMRAVQSVAERIAPDSTSLPISRTEASMSRTEVNLLVEQQRALQDALRKIEGLVATQQQSMDKLLGEQRPALRGVPGQAGGTTAPRNVEPGIPKPPETTRKM